MTTALDIDVRRAHDGELDQVVRLRWIWATIDNGETPEMDEPTYVSGAVEWARDHTETHIPFVAATGSGEIVGMAWLALTPRVAHTRGFRRWSGDLQSCYVLPEYRNQGVGGRLVRATLEAATQCGAEHVTVHASADSVAVYERSGFRPSPRLLFIDAAITER